MLLNGNKERQYILEQLREPFTTSPVEIGLSIETIARVIQRINDRENTYLILFSSLFFILFLCIRGSNICLTGLFLLISMIIFFIKRWQEHYVISKEFHRESFDIENIHFQVPDVPSDLAENIRKIKNRNVVVYKNFYPFESFGIAFGQWLFAIDISRKKTTYDKQNAILKSCSSNELLNEILHCMKNVNETVPTKEVNLFIHGVDVPDFLRSGSDIKIPMSSVSNEILKGAEEQSNGQARKYNIVTFNKGRGCMLIQYFLRTFQQGNDIALEIHGVLMPPIAEHYCIIDKIPPVGLRIVLAHVITATILGPISTMISLFILCHKIKNMNIFCNAKKIKMKKIKMNPMFNFGSHISIREYFSSDLLENYFNFLDYSYFQQIIPQRIFDSFVSYFDNKDIDTSSLKNQSNTLINKGILINDGGLKTKNLVIGDSATLNINKMKNFSYDENSRKNEK